MAPECLSNEEPLRGTVCRPWVMATLGAGARSGADARSKGGDGSQNADFFVDGEYDEDQLN